ncbi:MAG: PilZ domain-containing protein [Myxococcota bacterium]
MLKDRRAHERVNHRCPVVLVDADGTERNGMSLDLSEGGVLIQCPTPVAVGARYRLRMHLAPGPVHVPVVVRRVARVGGQCAFGGQFVDPSPRAREILRRALAELIMRRSLANVEVAPRPGRRKIPRASPASRSVPPRGG